MTTTPTRPADDIVTALLAGVDDPRSTLEQLAAVAIELNDLRAQTSAKETEYTRLAASAEKFGITATQLRAAGLPAPTTTRPPRTRKTPAKNPRPTAPAAGAAVAAETPNEATNDA